MTSNVIVGDLRRVLVLGESNSVLRDGWVWGLSEGLSGKFIIDNKSIGSTSVLNAIYQIFSGNVSIDRYHTVILDTMINDNGFFRNSVNNYVKILSGLFSYLSRFDVNVIFVNFERCGDGYVAPLREVAESLCDKYGVLFFDTRERIFSLALSEGRKLADFYLDSAHPKPDVSFDIGLEVSRLISDYDVIVDDSKITNKLYSKFDSGFSGGSCFYVIDYKNTDEGSWISLKNSLIDLTGFVVDDRGLIVDVPDGLDGCEIIGVVYNAGDSTGCLMIESESSVVKRLTDYRRSSGNPALVVWARPLKKKLIINSEIRLTAVRSHDFVEPTEHTLESSILDSNGPLCKIVALLVFSDNLI